jgi:hypothetical protein
VHLNKFRFKVMHSFKVYGGYFEIYLVKFVIGKGLGNLNLFQNLFDIKTIVLFLIERIQIFGVLSIFIHHLYVSIFLV